MSATDRRAREKQDLRRVILDAARELFATENYKDVSMRRIAEKIEYSPGSIYLYFKDKDEILATLAEEGFGLLADRLEKVKEPDPLARLRAIAGAYLEFAAKQPHYYRLMFEPGDGTHSFGSGDPERDNQSRRAYQVLVDSVRAGVASRDLSSQIGEAFAAHILWAELHGIASLAFAGRLGRIPARDHKAFFESAVDSVLCGLSPSCDP